MSDGLEIGASSWERQSLATFFGEKNGEGIVNVLEVGPLLYPLICVWVFWKVAREAEAVDLFCGKLVSGRDGWHGTSAYARLSI